VKTLSQKEVLKVTFICKENRNIKKLKSKKEINKTVFYISKVLRAYCNPNGRTKH
jgi:hypothetical protein